MSDKNQIDELKKQFEDMRDSNSKMADRIKEVERENGVLKAMDSIHGNKSVEKQIMAAFGSRDVAHLIGVNTAHPRYAHIPETHKCYVRQLKEDIDIARQSAQVLNGQRENLKSEDARAIEVRNIFETKFAKEIDLQGRVKALTTAGQPEVIMTAVSSQYIEEFELERQLQRQFREMPMPTSPFDVPVISATTKARLIGEGASLGDASFDFTKIRFSASKLGERYLLPEELNEDSVPAILTIARNELQMAHQRAIEDSLINGQKTSALDNDYAGGDDNRGVWDGLRWLALNNAGGAATVDFAATAIAIEKIDDMILLGDKFMVNPRDTIFLASPLGYNQLVALPEVSTVDKFGPMATILNGALSAIRGRGIIISEYLRDDLDATGVNSATPANNIKSGLLLVNKTRFMIGRRRPLRMRIGMDERYEFDRWQMAAYQRVDFEGHAQTATEKSVVYGINVALS